MNVINQKIWADLWGNKSRTIQVSLIVAIGAFAIGMILGGRNLTLKMFNEDWASVVPPTIALNLTPGISEEELQALESIDGVQLVDGFASLTVEWRRGPGDNWQNATLSTRTDYTDQKLSTVALMDGVWPDGRDVAIELGYDELYGASVGSTVELRINDRERTTQITGMVNNATASPFLSTTPIFYMTMDRFGEVTDARRYTQVQILQEPYIEAEVAATDATLTKRFDNLGVESAGALLPENKRYQEPGIHPLAEILDPILLTLLGVGAAVIVLGNFLVYNSVTAVITQQVGQIGVMKAIGARQSQVLRVYLTLILAYGILASLIAAPLAIFAAHQLKLLFGGIFGIPDIPFEIDWVSVGLLVLTALISPLIGSLVPILQGAGITVREAISTYGLGSTSGLIDQIVARLKSVPYTVLLMIGNTFRNLTRVSLTQIVLVGSGIVFMAIYGIRDSASYTFTDKLTEIHDYQISLRFADKERIAVIENLTLAQPGVTAVESWNSQNGTIRPSTQLESTADDQALTVYGIPLDSNIYTPEVDEGRWFQPGEENVVLLHNSTADEIEVGVGDYVIFEDNVGHEISWRVIGLFFDPGDIYIAIAPREAFSWSLGEVNVANSLRVQLAASDAESAQVMVDNLKEVFKLRSIEVTTLFGPNSGETIQEISENRLFAFNTILLLLMILAVLIAAVGGIGLSGMLSLSVLERTREIGVMRAIGASSQTVTRLFIGEGLIQGLMSWLIALPFSIPLAYLASLSLGNLMNAELRYHFTPMGPILWLIIIIILSILASWFPARNATRVSVRESLAYQ